jgi:hypothetical protein
MAYLRDRRAFGNIGTRKFRGARFGDPLSPRGPQYTKEGLILDYSTDVGPFTIIDQSGQDNTATLYSGRGLTMDAVNDTVTYATGYSSASRTATLWGKFNTTSPVALLGSVSGSFIFTPTATGVWEKLTSTATVEGDLAWDLGLDFDIGDLRVGTEHWTHNDWSNPAGNTSNGKTIVDSGPNGYHGVCTGCSGFTGEATIPQTADRNWNKAASLVQAINASPASIGWDTFSTTPLGFVGSMAAGVGIAGWNLPASVGIGERVTVRFFATFDESPLLQLRQGTLPSTAGAAASDNIAVISGYNEITLTATATASSFTFSEGDSPSSIGITNISVEYLDAPSENTQLVSASDANDQIDALGNAILEPRRNTQQLNLFGEGEYSSTPDSDSLDLTTAATWELWGNFYGVPATSNYLFAKWDFVDGQNRAWAIMKNTAGLDSDLSVLWGNPSTGATVGSSVISIADKVSHIAFTYAAGTVVAYVDGVSVSVASSSIPASLFQSSIPVTINATGSTVADRFWDRKIGSAKIYNRALTADEVLTNYDTQKSLYFNVFPFTLT